MLWLVVLADAHDEILEICEDQAVANAWRDYYVKIPGRETAVVRGAYIITKEPPPSC